MTINLYESYNNKRRKLAYSDTETLRQAYVEAANMVFAELNSEVFQTQTLQYLNSFDDVIDKRLGSFTTLTYASTTDDVLDGREYWSAEWELERKSTTNSFVDTIADDASNVVVSITDDVLTVTGGSITGTLTLPSGVDTFTLLLESYAGGNTVLIDGDEYSLDYTVGGAETTQGIGTVSSHTIGSVSGWELTRTRFLTAGTVIYDFPLNYESLKDGSPLVMLDDISSQELTEASALRWDDRYIEPSTGLDSQYRACFNLGIDYYLQEGGEWALESIDDRERKWYGRGIPMARTVYQNNTTFIGPLGLTE